MSTNTVKPVRRSYWIHSIVFVVLSIGIGFLPPVGQITEYGMDILGLFIGLIYGWSFIGFLWPSIFGFIVLGFTSFASNVDMAVSTGFSQPLIWQVFFMMLFAEIMNRLGLTEYIGYWLISRKICIGRPWVFVFILFTASWIVGGLVSQYAAAFMLWSILYELFEKCGFEKRSGFVTYCIAGIMFIAAMACMVFPFEPYPMVTLGLCADAGATTLPFVPWLVVGVTTAVMLSLIYILVGKYIFKFDLSALKQAGMILSEHHSNKMTYENKIAMTLLTIFIAVLVLVGILPDSIVLIAFFKKLNLLGLALLAICVVLIWRRKDGSPLLTFRELMNGVSWEIVIMFAVTLPLGSAMESADTGIMKTVLDALIPVFGSLSPAAFVAVCIVVLGLLTQVAHNLVLTMTFTPMLASLAVNYGIDPLLMGFLLVTIFQCATATPAASAQAAAVYSNEKWVGSKYAYIFGIAFAIISILVMICIAYPLGSLLF